MTAPSLLLPCRITGKTTPIALTTTFAAVLDNPAGSGMLVQLKHLLVSNAGANAAVVAFKLVRGSGNSSVEFQIAPSVSVAAGANLTAFPPGFELNLEEGDSLAGKIVSGASVSAYPVHNVVK
jgi:hypothetical protein